MKRIFSYVMVILIFGSALWINVGTAGATSAPPPSTHMPKVNLYSPYFKDLNPGKRLPTQMFVESNFENVHCFVTNDNGYVTCDVPKKYAGLSVVLHIQTPDKNLIFYLNLPALQDVKFISVT